MSERLKNGLRQAQINAAAIRRLGGTGNGLAMGIARDRKSLLQVVWAARHSFDDRYRIFQRSADAYGPTLQTVIREVDGSSTTIDTMLTRPIRGRDVRGTRHVVGTSDIRVATALLSHRTNPHQIHELGYEIEPEGEEPNRFRRILGVANVGIISRRPDSYHGATFAFMARPLHSSGDPMKLMESQPREGSFRDRMRPGAALAVYGTFQNDEQAFNNQPVALPLGPNSKLKEVDDVGRYVMDLTGAMAVGVKRIIPTVAEPEIFYINASK